MSLPNQLTNPAVSASGEAVSLLIEKFTGRVHSAYVTAGENLLNDFEVQSVVGTNQVTDKFFGETELQVLTPGQSPEASPVDADKNSLVVDTIVIGRNSTHQLHTLQNDFSVMDKLAKSQSAKMKSLEDAMVIQQVATGALTGGIYDPDSTNIITGGKRRLDSHGVAIRTSITPEQARDPYSLASAIELTVMGMIVQYAPMHQLKVVVPVEVWGTLNDYKLISAIQGGTGTMEAGNVQQMSGILTSAGVRITSSVEFTRMRMLGPNGDGLPAGIHHKLSNKNNNYRYDVTEEMLKTLAIIYAPDGLLCGRTIGLTSSVWFDDGSKSHIIDSWMSEGAIPNRYDCLGMVDQSAVVKNDAVALKADAKVIKTKSIV